MGAGGLARTLSLFSPGVLTQPARRERSPPIRLDPAFMTLFNLNYVLKAPSPNTDTGAPGFNI